MDCNLSHLPVGAVWELQHYYYANARWRETVTFNFVFFVPNDFALPPPFPIRTRAKLYLVRTPSRSEVYIITKYSTVVLIYYA